MPPMRSLLEALRGRLSATSPAPAAPWMELRFWRAAALAWEETHPAPLREESPASAMEQLALALESRPTGGPAAPCSKQAELHLPVREGPAGPFPLLPQRNLRPNPAGPIDPAGGLMNRQLEDVGNLAKIRSSSGKIPADRGEILFVFTAKSQRIPAKSVRLLRNPNGSRAKSPSLAPIPTDHGKIRSSFGEIPQIAAESVRLW